MAAAASLLSCARIFFSHLPSAPLVPRSARFQRFDRVRHLSPAAMSTASGPKEVPANNPGLHTEIDPATKGYFLQQTMLRVKDPKVSLDFYSRVMGMSFFVGILGGTDQISHLLQEGSLILRIGGCGRLEIGHGRRGDLKPKRQYGAPAKGSDQGERSGSRKALVIPF